MVKRMPAVVAPELSVSKTASMGKWSAMLFAFGGFFLFYFSFLQSNSPAPGASAIMAGLGVILFLSSFQSMYKEEFNKLKGA